MSVPSVLVMAKSALTTMVSLSVAELLLGLGSAIPAGPVTRAVLRREPVAEGETVALRVKVAVPPLSRLTVVLIEPVPLAAPQLDPADGTQFQVAPVIAAGTLSATPARGSSDLPLFLTTIV